MATAPQKKERIPNAHFMSLEATQASYPVQSPFKEFYFSDQSIPAPTDVKVHFEGPVSVPNWMPLNPSFQFQSTLHKQLNVELEFFSAHVSHTRETESLVSRTLCNVRNALGSKLPANTIIDCFGSSVTCYSTCTSDCDIGVCPPHVSGKNIKTLQNGRIDAVEILKPLQKVVRKLARFNNVLFVRHARVPLLRYTDRWTGMQVDLSVQWEGFEGCAAVRRFALAHPETVPVAQFLKRLLAEHNLADASCGGLNGISIVCMVLTVAEKLKTQSREATARSSLAVAEYPGAGSLLIATLVFYGFMFDPASTGIDMHNNGVLFYRSRTLPNYAWNSELYISNVWVKDPPENLARSCNSFSSVRSVLQCTYHRIFEAEAGGLNSAALLDGLFSKLEGNSSRQRTTASSSYQQNYYQQ